MNLSGLVAIFVFAAGSLSLLLFVKTDVQALHAERQSLVKKQQSLKEDIRVQRAELAYLTNPLRLGGLAQDMGMQAIAISQIIPIKAEAFLGVTQAEVLE